MQRAGAFTVPAAHPSLAGHFPGNPIVPGVVLLDEALARLEPGIVLLNAKFTAPVRAGQAVEVFATRDGPRVEFSCRVGGATVLRGTAAA